MHIDLYNILLTVAGILLGIVSFFLVRTMSRLDNTEKTAHQNTMDIALLKQQFQLSIAHIDEKLDGIKETVDEVRREVKKPHR